MVAILFGVMLVTLVMGIPIWISLMLAVMAGIFASGLPPLVIIQKIFVSIDSFPMLAIPFFILAGAIMEHGGMSRRLIRLASVLVGNFTGGLAMVSVVSCMMFGALTGSAPATTAAIGGVMIGEMEKKGYDSRFSAALLAIMMLGLSQVTPPVALSLFVASRISGRTIEEIIPALLPFLGAAVVVSLFLTYLPGVVMFLPHLLAGR